MTYEDHIAFLDREIRKLSAVSLSISFRSFLEVLDQQGLDEADAACRVFAATLEWPKMSDLCHFEICARLSAVKLYCKSMANEDPLDSDGKAFLESLLIEWWRDVGRVEWIHYYFVERFHYRTNYYPSSVIAADIDQDEYFSW